jgi:ATP-dependent DNA helicase RecG
MGIGKEDNKQTNALREGLVNLLIHSDYFSPMKPRIRVFTNRIEFENPGSLPRPIKELMKEDVSLPRNPVLAKLFRCAKLCETAGYGIDKILSWEEFSNKKVLFETSIDKTKVTFMLNKSTQKTLKNITKKVIENNTENNTEKLSKTQKIIIKEIEKNPNITSEELSSIVGITADNVRVNLSKLKSKGLIERVGADKGGSWKTRRRSIIQ